MTTHRCLRSAAATTVAAAVVSLATPALADNPPPDPLDNVVVRSVTIDSTRGATVVEKLSSTQDQHYMDVPMFPVYEQPTWSVLCVTPCRAKVDLNGVYRVGPENGATMSSSFTLPPSVGALHVSAGSSGVRGLARVLLVAGSLGAAAGAATVFASSDTSTQRTGFALGGAGLLGVAIGIPLFILSRTRLQFD
jgi:hypothetical protein